MTSFSNASIPRTRCSGVYVRVYQRLPADCIGAISAYLHHLVATSLHISTIGFVISSKFSAMSSPRASRPQPADFEPVAPQVVGEVSKSAQNIQKELKKLESHQEPLRKLAEQSVVPGSSEGAVAKQLQKFRDTMKKEDEGNDQAIKEIRGLLEEVLTAPMIEQLTKEIEGQITSTIDQQVKEEVAKSLKEHTSEKLQADLEESLTQIEKAQKELFNAESRRANSLRRRDGESKLEPLFKPDGSDPSPSFPKDLEALFALDDNTVRELLRDYQLSIAPGPDARDLNLNTFMREMGVMYQMKRTAGGASQPVYVARY
ncbi:hypothetical protein OE88DRAFT_1660088 [Heliocybe sulcata]|uniref:Uncharacterized protein n=1 Tax=Heliocybe sulcata TaxID=5364 RepID=A0A5C3N189_9AGAM|nr:hypothetical protein OE88DRAFT_1660088 [Heliocybe sulcata]